MSGSQVLPEGLVGLPPGPELGAALGSLDLTRCSSADLHTVLVLQSKQLSYEQARLWDVMLEAGYAQSDEGVDPSSRVRELDEFSASQAAFSLTWSRVATSRQMEVARDLIERLPMVYAAVRAGRIDPVRAVVFSKALRGLDDETARAIAAGLIEKAERWTAGQLGERLRYRVLKADPSLAKKRYQQSVADRRVFFRPYLDGTAEMGAVNLPPQLAAAAFDRINRLAKAAYAAGDVRTLNQLRTDAYLDLLIGKQFVLQPSTDPLTREADAAGRADGIGLEGDCGDDPIVPRERRPPRNRPASGFWARRSDSKATRDGARHNPHDLQDQPDPNRTQRAGNTGTGYRFPAPGPGTGQGAHSSGYRFPGPDPETEPIGAAGFDPTDFDPPPPDQPPGQAAPVSDPVVRGSDDPRMCTCGGIQPAPRRGQVDIHIEASTLMCLNDNPGLIPGWGPGIADIARQVAFDEENNPAWKFTVTDSRGVPTHHGHTTRRPNAKEKAFVKARDKTCKAPGCRQPAMQCDDDHRYDWVRGRPSHRGVLCVLCRHHHRLRHERGFVIHQIWAGTYMWEAPNGKLYFVLPDGNLLLTAEDHERGPTLEWLLENDPHHDDDFDPADLIDPYAKP